MENPQQQPETSLQSASEDQSVLLLAGIQAVAAGLENQRLKDQNEHLLRIKAMETNQRQLERMLDHDWKKFNRVFWLSALAVATILAVAAGLIFIAKDADKGVLALLAGRGLSRSNPKPQA